MNKIEAKVKNIQSSKLLHVVTFVSKNIDFTMMALELPKGVLIGSKVILGIKPSFVVIAREQSKNISFSNQVPSTVFNIDKGELVAVVKLESEVAMFESLITRKSLDMMELKIGEAVVVMMKASEISVIKVKNGD